MDSQSQGFKFAANLHAAPGLGNAIGSIYNACWLTIIITAGQQELGHGIKELFFTMI